jgi:hypothetical protein
MLWNPYWRGPRPDPTQYDMSCRPYLLTRSVERNYVGFGGRGHYDGHVANAGPSDGGPKRDLDCALRARRQRGAAIVGLIEVDARGDDAIEGNFGGSAVSEGRGFRLTGGADRLRAEVQSGRCDGELQFIRNLGVRLNVRILRSCREHQRDANRLSGPEFHESPEEKSIVTKDIRANGQKQNGLEPLLRFFGGCGGNLHLGGFVGLSHIYCYDA